MLLVSSLLESFTILWPLNCVLSVPYHFDELCDILEATLSSHIPPFRDIYSEEGGHSFNLVTSRCASHIPSTWIFMQLLLCPHYHYQLINFPAFRKSNDNTQHQPLCPRPHGKQQWWCEDAMTHWALIGPDWSRDLNTGLWLADSGDIPLFLPRLLSPLCRCQQCQWGVIVSFADGDTQELQTQRQTTSGPANVVLTQHQDSWADLANLPM